MSVETELKYVYQFLFYPYTLLTNTKERIHILIQSAIHVVASVLFLPHDLRWRCSWRRLEGRLSVSFVRVINVNVLIGLRYEQRHQREQGVVIVS